MHQVVCEGCKQQFWMEIELYSGPTIVSVARCVCGGTLVCHPNKTYTDNQLRDTQALYNITSEADVTSLVLGINKSVKSIEDTLRQLLRSYNTLHSKINHLLQYENP